MNYLAHVFLSGTHEQILVGNFVADAVRKSQWQHFPIAIQQGIHLHHAIDHFTDTHPAVLESISRLKPAFQKYAGVITDVFYDHFLSVHWQQYSQQDRWTYCQWVYSILDKHQEWLPEPMQKYLPDLIQRNWLYFYGEEYGVSRALHNLSLRSTHRKDFPEALVLLRNEYDLYRQDFLTFFPDIQIFVENWLAEYLQK